MSRLSLQSIPALTHPPAGATGGRAQATAQVYAQALPINFGGEDSVAVPVVFRILAGIAMDVPYVQPCSGRLALPILPACSGKTTSVSTQDDMIYRDDDVTAFMAAGWWPNNRGHVVPNGHYKNLMTCPRSLEHRFNALSMTSPWRSKRPTTAPASRRANIMNLMGIRTFGITMSMSSQDFPTITCM